MTQSKVVIVTGGARGIGAATALLFAEQGFDVCINYISNNKAADEVSESIRSIGRDCLSVKADISTEAGVLTIFSSVDKHFGRVDVLVNNVGIIRPQSKLVDMTESRINEVLSTNVTSFLLCSREAVKRMSTSQDGNGGSIVNVSSGASRTGSPNEYIDYAASKGAIDTLTKGLATELASEGIRVNCVRPGMIHTAIHGDGGEPDRVERLKFKVPLLRGGDPIEIAEAIYWLASDKASYTTGSILDVTGGL